MTPPIPEIRVTDSKARVTLPRSFANSTLLLEVRSDTEIVLRKAKVVPVDEAETGPVSIKLSAVDWDKFVALLDTPAEPNDPLKELGKEFGTWKESGPFKVDE